MFHSWSQDLSEMRCTEKARQSQPKNLETRLSTVLTESNGDDYNDKMSCQPIRRPVTDGGDCAMLHKFSIQSKLCKFFLTTLPAVFSLVNISVFYGWNSGWVWRQRFWDVCNNKYQSLTLERIVVVACLRRQEIKSSYVFIWQQAVVQIMRVVRTRANRKYIRWPTKEAKPPKWEVDVSLKIAKHTSQRSETSQTVGFS